MDVIKRKFIFCIFLLTKMILRYKMEKCRAQIMELILRIRCSPCSKNNVYCSASFLQPTILLFDLTSSIEGQGSIKRSVGRSVKQRPGKVRSG